MFAYIYKISVTEEVLLPDRESGTIPTPVERSNRLSYRTTTLNTSLLGYIPPSITGKVPRRQSSEVRDPGHGTNVMEEESSEAVSQRIESGTRPTLPERAIRRYCSRPRRTPSTLLCYILLDAFCLNLEQIKTNS